MRAWRLSGTAQSPLTHRFKLLCKALCRIRILKFKSASPSEILKGAVSFETAVFVKFQNFRISAEFNLADLIASAAPRVK
nr:hypothetical protein [uncultured Campylobacter sp.]